jgi:hypothetical protein
MNAHRDSKDQQSPHACGIDESAGSAVSQDRVTPPGIAYDVPVDDVLRTPGELKMGSSTEGMTPDSLADITRAALAPDSGFEKQDSDVGTYRGDGAPTALTSTNEADPASAPHLHDAQSATDGFLGRSRLLMER